MPGAMIKLKINFKRRSPTKKKVIAALIMIVIIPLLLQVKLAKGLKKGDKIVSDSQERAYWRIHRPPPGIFSSMEVCPIPTPNRENSTSQHKTPEDWRREVSKDV